MDWRYLRSLVDFAHQICILQGLHCIATQYTPRPCIGFDNLLEPASNPWGWPKPTESDIDPGSMSLAGKPDEVTEKKVTVIYKDSGMLSATKTCKKLVVVQTKCGVLLACHILLDLIPWPSLCPAYLVSFSLPSPCFSSTLWHPVPTAACHNCKLFSVSTSNCIRFPMKPTIDVTYFTFAWGILSPTQKNIHRQETPNSVGGRKPMC